MDIVIVLLICLIGLTRINTNNVIVAEQAVVNEVTGEVRNTYSHLEMGNNLMLHKENDAFMFYVKELIK